MTWTAEELAEMAAADAEIETGFCLTEEDILRSDALDKTARAQDEEPEQAARRRYYLAHRARMLAYARAYYQKNQETIRARKRRYWRENSAACAARQAERRSARRLALAPAQADLRFRRQALGLTQAQFGQALGVTAKTVCQWERGNAKADRGRIEAAFPGFFGQEDTNT